MQIQFRVFIFLLLLSLGACTAAPKLEDYPLREIDRPFTLPEGLATWSTLGLYQYEEVDDSFGKTSNETIIPALPLFWRQSLSDDWNLVWAPIPLAAMFQIRNDKKAVTGLTFGPAGKCCSDSWSIGFHVEYSHRQILNDTTALEFQPAIQPLIPGGEKAVWDLQTSASTGALYQASDRVAVRAGLTPLVRRDRRLAWNGTLGSSDFNIRTDDSWRFVLPLYAGFTWAAGRQWDFSGQAIWQRIGETQGYTRWNASYSLTHYW